MTQLSRLSIVTLLSLLASCSSTQQVVITTLEPAKVNLPDKVARIGVISGAQSYRQTNLGKGIDRLVAIEDQWLVTKGHDAALNSLIEELREDHRFEVESLTNTEHGLTNAQRNLTDISWKAIKAICKEYNVDALFSLTHFDAETNVSLRRAKVEQLNMMREKVKITGHEIRLETLINNNWRIYDPFLEKIIDEYSYDQQFVSKARGVDPVAALRAIGSRKDSILSKGLLIGNSYGERLKPHERKIFRAYFVKGSDKLVQAGKRMALGDVITAKKLWKEEVNSKKVKIKGRACYNLAVGMEFEGKLEAALEWASKANANLRDKNSQQYLNALKSRISQQSIVEKQLAELNFED